MESTALVSFVKALPTAKRNRERMKTRSLAPAQLLNLQRSTQNNPKVGPRARADSVIIFTLVFELLLGLVVCSTGGLCQLRSPRRSSRVGGAAKWQGRGRSRLVPRAVAPALVALGRGSLEWGAGAGVAGVRGRVLPASAPLPPVPPGVGVRGLPHLWFPHRNCLLHF